MGADINIRNQEDKTLLHSATKNTSGDLMIREIMKSKKADINAPDKYGNTPFHDAARLGLIEIYDTLIIECADNTIKNNNGETPPEISKKAIRKIVPLANDKLEKLNKKKTALKK